MLFLRKDSYGTVHFCAPLWREEREKVFRTIASGTVYKGEKIWYNRIIMEGISEREYIMISGATGGVGKAFAFACAPRGALFLTGRSSEKLLHLKSELEETFGGIAVDFFACDLADEKQREAMFAYIQGKGYRFGGLCNVAGVDIQKAFEKYTQEKIVFQARVNFEAALSLTHFVLHNRAPRLDIVTVSSLSGVYPMPYFAEYSATKCALTSFFFSLRLELKKKNVHVTVVEPGGIYTRPDICENIKGQGLWGKLSAKKPEYIARKSLAAVAKNKRLIRPGFWNKFIATVPRVMPLRVRMRFIARRWSKIEKDAF